MFDNITPVKTNVSLRRIPTKIALLRKICLWNLEVVMLMSFLLSVGLYLTFGYLYGELDSTLHKENKNMCMYIHV